MVSLRFPFSFSQSAKLSGRTNASTRSFSSSSAIAGAFAAAATAGVGIGIGLAISDKVANQKDPFLQKVLDFFISHYRPDNNIMCSPVWGCLSLAGNPTAETVVESKTGSSFPAVLSDNRRLLGIGLRKKSVLGLKNIDVYAFGVYADDADIKNLLSEKYGKLSVTELKGSKQFQEDVMDKDIGMTVRLQIVYGRLSIRSVRSAFEESVGSRLQKFGGADNKELLRRFTSLFKDEYKIPRGSVIELSRDYGHLLRITIDGKGIGGIQSKLLCRSVFDLYIGDDPFDACAKEDVLLNLASLL